MKSSFSQQFLCPALKLLWIVAILGSNAIVVSAQTLQQMNFESINEREGLSNHWVTDIALDSLGYLWIATRDGLNRYDGYHCKVFRHRDGDSSSLLNDNIQYLKTDDQGEIWVSYNSGGISKFDGATERFVHFNKVEGKMQSVFQQIAEVFKVEKGKGVWLGGMTNGFCFYDFKRKDITQINLTDLDVSHSQRIPAGFNSVLHLFDAGKGIYWLCSVNGLYRFDANNRTMQHKRCPLGPGDERIDCFSWLLPDEKKGFWLCSIGGGILYFDLATESFRSYRYPVPQGKLTLNNHTNQILPRNQDEYWIASGDQGLGIFNRKTGGFTFRQHPPEEDHYASKIVFTKNQVMFLLENAQVLKYNPYKELFYFQQLQTRNSQNPGSFTIQDILDDTLHHLTLFATDIGEGVVVADHRNGKLTSLPVATNPKSGNNYMRVYDMLQEKGGNIWILSRDYLFGFNAESRKLSQILQPFSGDDAGRYLTFRTFVHGKDDRICVLTGEGGIYPFLPTEKKLGERINDSLKFPNCPKSVSLSAYDHFGNLWVVNRKSLGYFDPAYTHFYPVSDSLIDTLLQNRPASLSTDKKGDVWIAIPEKGVLHIRNSLDKGPRSEFLDGSNQLPTNRVLTLTCDEQGNIWMNSVKGVICMNIKTGICRVFNHMVGIDRSSMILYMHKSGHGNFYLTSGSKFCKIDYEKLSKKMPFPQLYLDKFRVFNVEKSRVPNSDGELVLKPDEDFFSFEFGCIDYVNQNGNQFAYKLEGWDKEWIYCGNRRYASYTNLKGGHYVFKVRVANLDGIWGEALSIPIYLQTHFYKTTWFALCCIVFFVICIYSFYHFRITQIEKNQQLKTTFNKQLAETRMAALRAQMNPHFIFNCLNSINRYIIKSDVKTSSMYLTKFARLIRLILDNSQNKNVVLSRELEALKLYIEMEALRFDHKFTFEIKVEENVDQENIEIPPLIIQPYVENAIWHGLLHKETAGHLSVHVTGTDDLLTIEIADNGIGRQKAQAFKSVNAPTRQSIGMQLTEERILLAGDALSSENKPKVVDLFDEHQQAAGTLVIIQIPI